MKIAIGSDHGGYKLKTFLIDQLTALGHEMVNCGTDSLDSVDYPDFAYKTASIVANKEADYGILVCTTGEGISIAANKVKGIRCGIGYNDDVAIMMRKHNDANMIAFGEKYTSNEDALKRVLLFLGTEFEGGRHSRRVEKINNYNC